MSGSGTGSGQENDGATKHRRAARVAHAGEMSVLATVMGSPDGRRWVYGILERSHQFETTFTGNSAGSFKEGKRALGLSVLADVMDAAPQTYITMIEENKAYGK